MSLKIYGNEHNMSGNGEVIRIQFDLWNVLIRISHVFHELNSAKAVSWHK